VFFDGIGGEYGNSLLPMFAAGSILISGGHSRQLKALEFFDEIKFEFSTNPCANSKAMSR
jgi:hypothetical protein